MPRSLVPGLRGLCARLGHAHNGPATACELGQAGVGLVQHLNGGPLHPDLLQHRTPVPPLDGVA